MAETKNEKKNERKIASTKLNKARISTKQSMVLVRRIKGKPLGKAKKWLQDLSKGRTTIEERKTGKTFPTTAKKFIEAIETLEANAKVKQMDVDKLFLVKAHANAGESFYLPKSRFHLRGRKAKSTNITLVAAER